MKVLSILLGICFIVSVSQKSFACDCADKKTEKTAAAGTLVADASNVSEGAATPADPAAGATCGCEKAGKECKCGKHKKHDKAHKHKKGDKDCGCSDKAEKA